VVETTFSIRNIGLKYMEKVIKLNRDRCEGLYGHLARKLPVSSVFLLSNADKCPVHITSLLWVITPIINNIWLNRPINVIECCGDVAIWLKASLPVRDYTFIQACLKFPKAKLNTLDWCYGGY